NRLADVRDRLRRYVHVPDASVRERPAAPSERDEPAIRVQGLAVPCLWMRPRHRPARILTPLALEPDLGTGEDHRYAGRGHLQSDPDELALPRARERSEADDVVAVQDGPRVERRGPRDTGAEGRHRAHDRVARKTRNTHGRAEEDLPRLGWEVVPTKPGPNGPREARVVHR